MPPFISSLSIFHYNILNGIRREIKEIKFALLYYIYDGTNYTQLLYRPVINRPDLYQSASTTTSNI